MRRNILLCLVLISTIINAQRSFNPLKIGDTIPDIYLNHVINNTNGNIQTSDFKGKLLILDFWSQGCKSCIASFPKMEQLQDEFQKDVQILAVNYYDSWESLKKWGFPDNTPSRIITNSRLTFVIDSRELKDLFPHSAEPFHAWIDKKGVVRALTNGYNTTKENILRYLKFDSINLPSAVTFSNYDYKKSILEEGGGRQIKNLSFYSVLTKLGNNESSSGAILDSTTGEFKGLQFFNLPILSLFQRAFSITEPDRVLFNLSNADDFFPPDDPNEMSEWLNKNSYSYEVKAPEEDMCRRVMQNDLQLYFKIDAKIESKIINCLVLSKIANENKIIKPRGNEAHFLEATRNYFHLSNTYFGSFIELLRIVNQQINKSKALPIIDKTGLNTMLVNIEINAPFSDLNKLNQELNKYGLEIKKSKERLDVLVLSNTNR